VAIAVDNTVATATNALQQATGDVEVTLKEA
jgi:hypothetical protein